MNTTRRERRGHAREAIRAKRARLMVAGKAFEVLAVRRHEESYTELYRQFLEAYTNTSKSFNSKTRFTKADTYWFRDRYKKNWLLRLRRTWFRIVRPRLWFVHNAPAPVPAN